MSLDVFNDWEISEEFCECRSLECSDTEVLLGWWSSSFLSASSFLSGIGDIASISISPGLARVLALLPLLSPPPLLLLLLLRVLLLQRLREGRRLPLLALARDPRGLRRLLLRLPLLLPLLLLSLSLLFLSLYSLWYLLLLAFSLFLFLTPNRHGCDGQGSITPSPVPFPNCESCPR